MMERDDKPTMHNTGRLWQEWLCDMYSKVEEERLSYHRNNQPQLRADTLDGLQDALSSADCDERRHGACIKSIFIKPVIM